MKGIFYTDDNTKAAGLISNISGRASSKVHIDPKALIEVHPLLSKLRPASVETVFENGGELIRLQPHQFVYKEGDQ